MVALKNRDAEVNIVNEEWYVETDEAKMGMFTLSRKGKFDFFYV